MVVNCIPFVPQIPTINQETAVLGGSEPTATLMNFRSDKILRPDKEKHRGRVSEMRFRYRYIIHLLSQYIKLFQKINGDFGHRVGLHRTKSGVQELYCRNWQEQGYQCG